MGNVVTTSRFARKLFHAAKVGDVQETEAILSIRPRLVRFKMFRGKNSPLHVATARGHKEIIEILLQRGANVNLRNGAGQTALMIACRLGRIPIVQLLLIYKAQIDIADDINGCTALHYAAGSGQVECLRLCLSDYVPSMSMLDENENITHKDSSELLDCPSSTLHEILNFRADGGITALHLASFYGKFDCVHLLLDLGAWVDAISLHQAAFECDVIGNYSSALHFAAYNGSISCCQILVAHGADRTQKNANGWTPGDVAKIRKHNILDGLLFENSQISTGSFSPSRFLAYPLMSIMKIAREIGLEGREIENVDNCGICFEKACAVEMEGCKHQLCCQCALQLCCTGQSYIAMSSPHHHGTSFSSLTMSPSLSRSTRSSATLASTSSSSFSASFASRASHSHSSGISMHVISCSSASLLAGCIPCPFCRAPITRFIPIAGFGYSDAAFPPLLLPSDVFPSGLFSESESHTRRKSRIKSHSHCLNWSMHRLPKGCLSIKEAEEIEEVKSEDGHEARAADVSIV